MGLQRAVQDHGGQVRGPQHGSPLVLGSNVK